MMDEVLSLCSCDVFVFLVKNEVNHDNITLHGYGTFFAVNGTEMTFTNQKIR